MDNFIVTVNHHQIIIKTKNAGHKSLYMTEYISKFTFLNEFTEKLTCNIVDCNVAFMYIYSFDL